MFLNTTLKHNLIMKPTPMTLKQFVFNFFENQRYQGADLHPLSSKEISTYTANPQAFQNNRIFMDRLIHDGEAIESIEGSLNSSSSHESKKGKVVSFHPQKTTFPIPLLSSEEKLQKVADDRVAPLGNIGFEDQYIKGFIQQIDYKNGQSVVSGHFKLKDETVKICLILSDGTQIDQFEQDHGQFIFKTILKDKVDLSQTHYELL